MVERRDAKRTDDSGSGTPVGLSSCIRRLRRRCAAPRRVIPRVTSRDIPTCPAKSAGQLIMTKAFC